MNVCLFSSASLSLNTFRRSSWGPPILSKLLKQTSKRGSYKRLDLHCRFSQNRLSGNELDFGNELVRADGRGDRDLSVVNLNCSANTFSVCRESNVKFEGRRLRNWKVGCTHNYAHLLIASHSLCSFEDRQYRDVADIYNDRIGCWLRNEKVEAQRYERYVVYYAVVPARRNLPLKRCPA